MGAHEIIRVSNVGKFLFRAENYFQEFGIENGLKPSTFILTLESL